MVCLRVSESRSPGPLEKEKREQRAARAGSDPAPRPPGGCQSVSHVAAAGPAGGHQGSPPSGQSCESRSGWEGR